MIEAVTWKAGTKSSTSGEPSERNPSLGGMKPNATAGTGTATSMVYVSLAKAEALGGL